MFRAKGGGQRGAYGRTYLRAEVAGSLERGRVAAPRKLLSEISGGGCGRRLAKGGGCNRHIMCLKSAALSGLLPLFGPRVGGRSWQGSADAAISALSPYRTGRLENKLGGQVAIDHLHRWT